MLHSGLTLLIYVAPFLFVLGLVVTIHELGHFLAAKACGVAVDRFSIGFGRALLSWRDRSGVEWRLAWIPLGGYVKFAGDENAASVPDAQDLAALRQEVLTREGPQALQRYLYFKPLWQRAIVVAAGPFANFVLSTVLFAILLGVFGEPIIPARVDQVKPGQPAAVAGFQPGDVIERANNQRIESFQDLDEYVVYRAGMPIRFTVKRGDTELMLTATPASRFVSTRIGQQKIGWLFDAPGPPARVEQVMPDQPAALAGFKPGDVIERADSQPINFGALIEYIGHRSGTPIRFTVKRGATELSLIATPAARQEGAGAGQQQVGRLGIGIVAAQNAGDFRIRRYNPIQAVGAGAAQTWDMIKTTVFIIGRLVQGQLPAGQLSGPIGIAQMSGAVVHEGAEGAPNFMAAALGVATNILSLTAVVSVSVGFMNLLPVPVLDGGHLLFYAYEAAARRPLGARVQAAGYRVGLALLLGLMLFATWNDLQRLRVFQLLGGLFS